MASTLAACSDRAEPASGSSTTRRGDTLVVSIGQPIHPKRGQMITDWTVGGADAPEESAFSFISEIAVGRDGSVYVSEFGRPAPVRRYDPRGTYVGAIGRVGPGPGEYYRPSGVKVMPDGRVVLRDVSQRLIHFYEPSGEPDTTWRLPTVVTNTVSSIMLLVDTSGFVYIRDGLGSQRRQNVFDGLVRVGMGGIVIDSIPMPAFDYTAATVKLPGDVGGNAAPLAVPFAPRTHSNWSPLGYFVTAVSTTYAVDLRIPPASRGITATPATRGGTPRIVTQWQAGDEVISLRRTVEPVAVASAERNEQIAITEAQVRHVDRSWDWDGSDIPATKPPFRNVRVADDGRIWVLLSAPAVEQEPVQSGRAARAPPGTVARWVEPNVYDILEPDGRYIGQVETPPGLAVSFMRGDTLWGHTRDADDVPIVHRLHIVWP